MALDAVGGKGGLPAGVAAALEAAAVAFDPVVTGLATCIAVGNGNRLGSASVLSAIGRALVLGRGLCAEFCVDCRCARALADAVAECLVEALSAPAGLCFWRLLFCNGLQKHPNIQEFS